VTLVWFDPSTSSAFMATTAAAGDPAGASQLLSRYDDRALHYDA
jgi:hypothetical protein